MPIDFSPDTPMPIDRPVDRASGLPADPVHDVAVDSVVVVPLLQETMEVHRSRHETGAVRVRVVVEETTEQVVADSSFDEVTSTRVPRDVQVDARREPWH